MDNKVFESMIGYEEIKLELGDQIQEIVGFV